MQEAAAVEAIGEIEAAGKVVEEATEVEATGEVKATWEVMEEAATEEAAEEAAQVITEVVEMETPWHKPRTP